MLNIVERIQAGLTSASEGNPTPMSASIGIAITRDGTADRDGLVRAADTAMYEAKKQHRGGFEIFGEALRTQLQDRVAIERLLDRALAQDLFRLHYQPVVNLADNRVVGVEALIRVQQPGRGLLAPAEFLDVAEASGLIISIGDWALHAACRQQVAWRFGGARELGMSVNLSGREVLQDGLGDHIAATIETTGIDPARLTLELTETVYTEATHSFLQSLEDLKARGVRFALDDFGTGYSSFAYLEQFPVNSIKIGQRFIDNLLTSSRDATIVTAILSLGHTLDLTVVAEGVETREQLVRLRELGCDFAQGFHLARPAPPDEVDLTTNLTAAREQPAATD